MNESIVKHRRKAKGWSQKKLAAAAGVSRPTIQRVESGTTIALRTAKKICSVLGCTLDELVREDEKN